MKLKVITIEEENKKTTVLKKEATLISFPLSKEDKELIEEMKNWLYEAGGVGLAAPQINVSKKIAVVYIPEDATLIRENAKVYPMHVIINPEYKPVKEDESLINDFEACYSVKTISGMVPRYNTIELQYQNENGDIEKSIESGFYARVLQHEIDHLNGLLIIDRLDENCTQGSIEEMLLLKRKTLPDSKKKIFDKIIENKGVNLNKKN